MKTSGPVKTIAWTGRAARIVDQTLLPAKLRFIDIRDAETMWTAIKKLQVRGAPALGVAGAYGVYLGVRNARPGTLTELRVSTNVVADFLCTSRPTAVNLSWGTERMRRRAASLPDTMKVSQALAALLDEAIATHRSDEETCAAIARHGAKFLKGAKGILTHCNAGALATAGCGTAVGVIIEAAKKNKFTVYADETRPLLQGARLTAWELMRAGIETRLITDSMAATVLSKGLVQAVIVGADRIAANGDVTNKIGTLPLAICASHYGVPFYVAAPMSTIDPSMATGAEVIIEERSAEEVTEFAGVRTAPKGVGVFNPAFDVTPARFVTAIVTEKGRWRGKDKGQRTKDK